jgi:hypothetical protein
MWVVWGVTALSAGLIATCVLLLRGEWRQAERGWKLLASSGLPLALAGLVFIVRFWEPFPGPFVANEVYPLGPYLNAWAVSFGFMWLAFGLAFFALALRPRPRGRTWVTLLVAWTLAWIPHGIIGIGFATAGENAESLDLYQDWASQWRGLAVLLSSALALLSHFVLSLVGFGITGIWLLRHRTSEGSS